MVGLGLTAPFATQLLASAGLPQSPAPVDYRPTHAGGGGALRTLFWQAPTSLNPHFAVGAKDVEGAWIFYEPLSAWDPEGNLVPVLAAEIPNIENGGVAADGMSVTWKLKRGVQWHDGQPFTADDVVFNWEYASDPATAATTIGSYQDVEVEQRTSADCSRIADDPSRAPMRTACVPASNGMPSTAALALARSQDCGAPHEGVHRGEDRLVEDARHRLLLRDGRGTGRPIEGRLSKTRFLCQYAEGRPEASRRGSCTRLLVPPASAFLDCC